MNRPNKEEANICMVANALRREGMLTARVIGERLGRSERTIYRYVDRLRAAGIRVIGEAGAGYMLRGKH